MFNLKKFALEKPLLFSLLAILLGSLLTEIPLQKFFAPYAGAQAAHYLTIILEQGVVGGFCFILLGFFGWLDPAGFTPTRKWRALWLGWPLLLFTLINIEEGVVIDVSKPVLIALHLLTALSTGWIEEILFRGVVLTTLLQKWGRSRKGIYWVVLFSSALFGAIHLLNFIQGRKPLLDTAVQITFAIFFGVMFSACFLRNRTILPVILLHAAIDWAGTLNEVAVGGGLRTVTQPMSLENALISILITLPLFLYGLFILRKVDPTSLDLENVPTSISSPGLMQNPSLDRAVK
ncbi:MAG TPA: CPBP family intramembrane glutamic endopeptidase [Anaerolineales bacterium]|nr:CPBP family intramembrane glutamic endopeptidase [Anaerolineales bacterium]